MKKIQSVMILMMLMTFMTACGDKYENIETERLGYEYGEWEPLNSVFGSTDNQIVYSGSEDEVENTYIFEIGATWNEIINLTFGYEVTEAKIQCSGISYTIDSGQRIDFSYRTVADMYRITKNVYSDSNMTKLIDSESIEYPKSISIEYGWKIYDKDGNLIENTIDDEPIINISHETTDIDEVDDMEQYIIMADKEIIPYDILEALTDEELYIIRNGIYAYEGRIYTSDIMVEYLKGRSWYDPRFEHVEWENFNSFQQTNIHNIKLIEKSRK